MQSFSLPPPPDKPHRLARMLVFLFVVVIHIGTIVGLGLLHSHPPMIESGGRNLSYFTMIGTGDGQAGEQLESAAAAAAAAPPPPPETVEEDPVKLDPIIKTTDVKPEEADLIQKKTDTLEPKPRPEPKPKPIVKKKPPKKKPVTQDQPKPIPAEKPLVTKEGSQSTASTGLADGTGSHSDSHGRGGTQSGSGIGGGTAGGSSGVGFAPGSGHCTKPDYPHESIVLNETGTTRVRFMVEADGSVSAISLAKSSGSSRLDKAALKKAASCRFKPAKKAGSSVRQSVVVPYKFTLNQ